MKENTIVTLADEKYFDLLKELINSIKRFPESKNIAICVLDAGLNQTQVDEIAKNPQVQAIVEDNVIYLKEPIIEKSTNQNRQKVTYGLESLEVTKVWEKYNFLGTNAGPL